MGIKPVLNLLQQAGKIAGRYMDDAARIAASKGDDAFGALVRKADDVNLEGLRLAPQALEDTAKLTGAAPKMKLKFFTPDEILDMKPSTFKKILGARTDIPEYINKDLLTPEKLNLYDELMELEEIQRMPKDKLENAFKNLFMECYSRYSEASAQLEIIPDLVRKGFDLELLGSLPITNANKNHIEYLLQKGSISRIFFELATDKNAKYIDEILTLQEAPQCLPFWGEETAKIIKDFCSEEKLRAFYDDDKVKKILLPPLNGQPFKPETIEWGRKRLCGPEKDYRYHVLDIIHRRGHNYESIKHILGDENLTLLTAKLLEFKDFDLLKGIGLDDLEKLTVQQRKDFLNGFISAYAPNKASFMSKSDLDNVSVLQAKMKIFKELDTSSRESFMASHKRIVDRILNSIPEEERKIIDTVADTKAYRRDYRLANPIPTLVDDIETVLPTKTTEIKGRKIKVAVMEREPDFGIATHRIPNAETIKTVEALEITDPNMFICVGTGTKSRYGLNFNDSGYAIALKPRKGSDWHAQAYSDIDTDSGALKNIFYFENEKLPMQGDITGALSLVPNKIKQILDLSQRQYTARMLKIKDCRTLQEVEKIDFELAKAIRKMINETPLYEGLIRPEPMGVLVRQGISSDEIDDAILDYCARRNIPLIEVKPKA